MGKTFTQKIIRSLSPDFIYLNSVFSRPFTIDVVLAHRKIKSAAGLVLAPRGMFKPTALAIKPLKKKLFLWLAKFSGIYKSIHFHATNETELQEVKAVFGNTAVSIANNFPAAILKTPVYLEKTAGKLNLVAVGRIHPIKNIDFILKQLGHVPGTIHLDIIGAAEDHAYRLACEAIIQQLPKEKTVSFLGELPNHLLNQALSEHHLFVLPTLGENFGHAIAEALGNGRPVLISDQTPWRNLSSHNAGWDCPLFSPEMFRAALQEAADWNQDTFNKWCNGALAFAATKQQTNQLIQQYQQLFN
ncbi:MAG: glycosyltransferase [Bacteroidota bacterium]